METWQLVRGGYLINASYASKTRLTFDDLQAIAPGISVKTIKATEQAASSTSNSASDRRQLELEARAREAKLGISLVLEGVSAAGINELMAMASHLALGCRGAVVEAPSGFHQLDEAGHEIE